ncbi:MAG TPA: hypothetical protein VND01_00540 [Candidatus Acidoferrales bacterium]|nr:hypothetical protein [Candidatus Acidoferrales bacterium]
MINKIFDFLLGLLGDIENDEEIDAELKLMEREKLKIKLKLLKRK